MGFTRGFADMAYDSQKSADEAKALHAKAIAEPIHQDSRNTGGAARNRGDNCLGCSGQCHLLFSREQYEAAAEAYLRGLERRLSAELSLDVHSVASLFVSRWDKATWTRYL